MIESDLNLSFTSVCHLHFNFVGSESILELIILLYLEYSNLEYSIDCSNFSLRDYHPSVQKDFIMDIYGLAVEMKAGLSFAHNLSLEKSALFYFSL